VLALWSSTAGGQRASRWSFPNNQLRDIAFVEAYFWQHHHPRAPHTILAMWKNVPLSLRKSVMPAYLRATSAFYVRCELCDCNFINNYFVVRKPSNMLLCRIIRVSYWLLYVTTFRDSAKRAVPKAFSERLQDRLQWRRSPDNSHTLDSSTPLYILLLDRLHSISVRCLPFHVSYVLWGDWRWQWICNMDRNNFMVQSPWKFCGCSADEDIYSLPSRNSEGSVQCSQNSVIGFYLESDESSPNPTACFCNVNLYIIFPFTIYISASLGGYIATYTITVSTRNEQKINSTTCFGLINHYRVRSSPQ
jgi:hypothetical protein